MVRERDCKFTVSQRRSHSHSQATVIVYSTNHYSILITHKSAIYYIVVVNKAGISIHIFAWPLFQYRSVFFEPKTLEL